MLTYIIRRILMSVAVLFLVTVGVFLAMRLLPGDPIELRMAQSQSSTMTKEQLAAARHEYGLDRPLVVQYFAWVGGVLSGDLGTSISSESPVSDDLLRRLPITLHLGFTAWIIGTIIGALAGILCAVKRGSWIDTLVTTLANIGITMPTFWLGVMLMYLFGLHLHWLPIQGYTSPFDNFAESTRTLVLPVVCLALFPLAGTARQARSCMLEVLRQDYIRTAWSKGLRQKTVILKHAAKNGLIPVVTLAGMGLAMVVGGAVVIEMVFNIPGIGRMLITAISNQDYPVVQSVVLVIAALVVVVNLIIDLSYGWLDPRIRYN